MLTFNENGTFDHLGLTYQPWHAPIVEKRINERNRVPHPIVIERKLIREQLFIVEPVKHWKAWIEYIWPEAWMHEWRMDMLQAFCDCIYGGKKELSTHGSSNCHKTSTMAIVSLARWLIDPDRTSVNVTSPYKTATESGLWAEIVEWYQRAKKNHPNLPGYYLSSENIILSEKGGSKRASIKIVTSDKIGKMIGRKAMGGHEGMLFFLADEAPEFEAKSATQMVALMDNLISVPNMLAWFAGNFRDETDLLGIISEPEQGYEALDVDADQDWLTIRGGVCRRYDAHYSPNLPVKKYESLPDQAYIDAVLQRNDNNDKSPAYMRFVRSFPLLTEADFRITTRQKMRQGRVFEKFPEWAPGTIRERFSYTDPGFGGDPCAWQGVERGQVINDEGELVDHVHAFTPLIEIPIDSSIDDEDKDMQIALGAKKLNDQYSVYNKNHGFDSSMRPGITIAMVTVMPGCVAISNLDKPTDRDHDGRPCKELYTDFNTEQHFAVAQLIEHKQITGMGNCTEAQRDLTRRKWHYRGAKKRIQSKAQDSPGMPCFKSENNFQSPTGGDCIVGACHMATRKGFRIGKSSGTRKRKERKEVKRHHRPTARRSRLSIMRREDDSNVNIQKESPYEKWLNRGR